MATISKNNESVKSVVANKAWAVLVWLGNVCENTAKGLMVIIALLAITFIFLQSADFHSLLPAGAEKGRGQSV